MTWFERVVSAAARARPCQSAACRHPWAGSPCRSVGGCGAGGHCDGSWLRTTRGRGLGTGRSERRKDATDCGHRPAADRAARRRRLATGGRRQHRLRGRPSSLPPGQSGSAAGQNLTTRNNMLAYDLVTGALKTAFNPNLNGQALAVTASPDGSRIYVGGDFTTVGWRHALPDRCARPDTGAMITSFNARTDGSVKSLAATATTVYVGGLFTQVNGISPARMAALRASDGGLIAGFAPVFTGTADSSPRVNAIVLSPTADRLVIGGNFITLNGSNRPGYGLGMINATTGASLPIQVNDVVRNARQEQCHPLAVQRRHQLLRHRLQVREPAATSKGRSPATGRTAPCRGSRTATATPTAPIRQHRGLRRQPLPRLPQRRRLQRDRPAGADARASRSARPPRSGRHEHRDRLLQLRRPAVAEPAQLLPDPRERHRVRPGTGGLGRGRLRKLRRLRRQVVLRQRDAAAGPRPAGHP